MESGAASGTINARRPRIRLAGGVIAVALVVGAAVGFLIHLVQTAAQQQSGSAVASGPHTPAPNAFGAGVAHGGLYGQATWAAGQLAAPAIAGLRDQSGESFSLSALKGQPVVLTFLNSHCGSACAPTETSIVAAERALPAAQRPALVVVSTDPGATPAGVRAAARGAGLPGRGRWYWLTGSRSQLAAAWAAYHIQVGSTAGGGSGSTRAVYLLDAKGYQRAGFVYPFTSKFMAADMRKLAEERG